MNINRSVIFSIANDSYVYNWGYNFFLNNEINDLNIVCKKEEIYILTGQAVYFEDKFNFFIEFSSDGKVFKKKCTCKFFREHKKVCKHIIAGLIKYFEQNKISFLHKSKLIKINFDSSLMSLVFNKKSEVDYSFYFYVVLIYQKKHYQLIDIFFDDKKIYLQTSLDLIFCVEKNKITENDLSFFSILNKYWKEIFKNNFLVIDYHTCYSFYSFLNEVTTVNKSFISNIDYFFKNVPLTLDVFKIKNQFFFEAKNLLPANIENKNFIFQLTISSRIKLSFQQNHFLNELSIINTSSELEQSDRLLVLIKILVDSVFNPDKYKLNFLKSTYKNEISDLIPRIKIWSKLNNNQIVNNIEFVYNSEQKKLFKDADIITNLEIFLIEKLEKYLGKYDSINKIFVLSTTKSLLNYFDFKKISHENKFIDFFNYPEINDLFIFPYNNENKIKISVEQNKLELHFDFDKLNAKNIVYLLNVYKKTNYEYAIVDDKIICFDDKYWKVFFSFVSHLPTHDCEIKYKTIFLDKFNVMHISKYVSEIDLNVEIDENTKQLFLQINNNYIIDEKISPELKKKLFPYQIKGVKWLKTLYKCGFGGILADEMGLGKTVQIAAFISDIYSNSNNILKSLIITPASLVFNWKEELLKYAPNVRVGCITGDRIQRKRMLELISKYQIIITSKDYFLRDIKEYLKNKYEIVVVDEAQNIKNYKTRLAVNLKKISATNKFAVSGTPIENRLDELWSIFDFIMPGFLYKYIDFKNKYIRKIIDDKNQQVMNELKIRIRPFILQRLKKDVLKDLPEKIEHDQYVEMADEQKQIYFQEIEKINGNLKPLIDSRQKVNKGYVFSAIMKLKQICDTLRIFDENYSGNDAKFDACIELIKKCYDNNKKVLFFSQFVSVLKIVQKKLDELKIPYFLLTGQTNKNERVKVVKQFNDLNKPIIFLISLKAGGVGLNLTAAEVIIHYDLWWNYSVQNQATDRAHRIGQTKNVEVYRLIVKDSIEEKIANLQLKKKQLSEQLTTSIEKFVDKLSIQDLLNLFN